MARTKKRQAEESGKLALAERVAEATALQQKGAAGPAERLYREILAADPAQADALHNLGVICAQSSRLEEALNLIQRSLALKPGFAQAHNSLGIVFRRMGRGAEAIANYERALELDPNYVDACQNLGLALRLAGRFDDAVIRLGEVVRKRPASPDAQINLGLALKDAGHIEAAIAAFREALRLRPDHAESHRSLGAALIQSGRNDEALSAYERALALKPDQAELLCQIGNLLVGKERRDDAISAFRRALALKPDSPELLSNLGVALNNLERSDEAIECFNQALELRPDFAEALTNLGVALQGVDRLAEAETVLTRAVALKPDLAAVHTNLGTLRGSQNRFDEAIACYRQAISLQIDAMEAHQNLCAALLMLGRVDEAIESGRRAVEISPSHHASRFNLSTALLTAGEFADGWEAYEARPSHKEAARRLKHGLVWSLDAPKGSRVLIYSEQGLGDSIHFARYVRLVEARGDHVVLETRGPLRRLMSSLGKAMLIESNEPAPEVDYQISLVSLPRAFGTRLDDIPAEIPYLRANETDVARFRARFAGEELTIGLVWRGNPNHKNDRNRSLDPRLLEPLFKIEGVRFISLQKQPRDGDLDILRHLGPIEDPTSELNDFADTAALIEALDLVISVDTSVAHLAGALAKPVWILLPSSGDWRWLTDREDSPWYPTARLFRQRTRGDWSSVIARVATALGERVANRPKRETTTPMAPSDPFMAALAHQQAGRGAEAETLYLDLLEGEPNHLAALRNLGVLYLQRGEFARAATLAERAVTLDPDNADIHINLATIYEKQERLDDAAVSFARAGTLRPQAVGILLSLAFVQRKLGRYDDAIATGERALALDARSVDALHSLGQSLKGAGRYEEALNCFRRAVDARPSSPQVHLGYANALYELKRYDEAVAAYRRAIELKPDYGEAHGNLGVALKELNRFDEAQASFKRALELIGDSAELLTSYGQMLQAIDHSEEAIVQHRKALALKPDLAAAHSNLGIALAALDRDDEALAAYRRALDLKPDYPEALNNLGGLLKQVGRHDEARAAYDRALALRPDFPVAKLNRANIDYELGHIAQVIPIYREVLAEAPAMADAHANLAMALLLLGELAEGWKEQEWRWQRPGVKPHGFKQPMWHRAAPRGSRVLIHAEQGFGDIIQMARYVPRVIALGHRVKIGAPKPLRRWLGMLPEVEVIQTVERHSEVDFQIPVLSLPWVFDSRLDTIPADVPYLPVPTEEAARFRGRLGDGFKVGLVWRGSVIHKNDRNRSIDPRLLAPLFGIEGVQIVSLQKEPRPGDLDIVHRLGSFIDLTTEFSDFATTAALIETLDLVVSVDTSVAHVAGALGKPLFLMLPFVPDWRWLLEREDTPWYPSARLFRQRTRGDWPDVIARVSAALRERVTR